MSGNVPEHWNIGGREIRITSLDKVYWPGESLTKGDALRFYRRIAPTILPYLRGRPVTLRTYPDGIGGPGFWRRELPTNAPGWLSSIPYQPETRQGDTIDVPLVDDEAALVWYANHSTIEFHLWMSRRDDLDHPDLAVYDLDPGEKVGFAQVLRAALHVRDDLAADQLRGFAKTSGATGMHIFVPLAPAHSFEDVREWVHETARRLETRHPELIAAASGGTHHGDVVTIDHAQNSVARNTAAPYTLRARPGAPVSTPVTWEEVEAGKIRPGQFTLRTVPDRVDRMGDPWAGFEMHQTLPMKP